MIFTWFKNKLKKLLGRLRTSQKEQENYETNPGRGQKFVREPAARSSRLMERRVLSKQARRARADHLVTCSMEPGRLEQQVKKKSKLDDYDPHISLKERLAECSYGTQKRRISEVMSDHSLSS